MREDARICFAVQEEKRWMKIKGEINPASNSATVTGEGCLKQLAEATNVKIQWKWDPWACQHSYIPKPGSWPPHSGGWSFGPLLCYLQC